MTESEKIEMLTALTGESDPSTLSVYLFRAKDAILRKMNPLSVSECEMPSVYDMTQVEIAAFLLDKRGATGEKAHTENGVSRVYDDGDIPPALLRRIVPFAKVGF